MSAAAAPFVVARVGAERFGFDVDAVREVVPVERLSAVPATLAALRGVMPLRGRYVSVISLAALLGGGAAPAPEGACAVVVALGGRDVAFEVDEIEAVVDRGAQPVESAASGDPCSLGVWRLGELLVTRLDLHALAERIAMRPAGGEGKA